ncbi:GNAT family N-acetyltransferase [Brevibacterium sp. FME37]|uniref:GNAT family N-acetyltransferase n=1 Tax=Brevibacterium sp. FME37 TaxID=2742607 RepID=UPI001865B6E6|nr:GNAT family N-acetyltransferase [Brevibacterium sp. FME37]
MIYIQRQAFAIEAAIIGDNRIPQLRESAQLLIAAGLTWHVALTKSAIVAAIAYSDIGSSLEVDRLFVAPHWHRRGLARRLILSLGSVPIDVSTGRDNKPARRLYESLGFSHLGDNETLPGLWLSRYNRQ